MSEQTPKDFLGQELKVGDEVAFPILSYRLIYKRGSVIKIDDDLIVVKYTAPVVGFYEDYYESAQLIKIPDHLKPEGDNNG